MRRLLVPLAALALFACSDDDGGGLSADNAEDVVDEVLLTVDDLPDGFVEDEESDDDDEGGLSECAEDVLDIDPDDLDDAKLAGAGPVVFTNIDDLLEVRAEVTAFEDTELPQRMVDGLGDDDMLECIEEGLGGELPETAEITELEAIDSPAGEGAGLRVVIEGGGDVLELQQHAVLVEGIGIQAQVMSLSGEFDDDLIEDVLETMVDRAEDALEDL